MALPPRWNCSMSGDDVDRSFTNGFIEADEFPHI